jgi:hypothetical protein
MISALLALTSASAALTHIRRHATELDRSSLVAGIGGDLARLAAGVVLEFGGSAAAAR